MKANRLLTNRCMGYIVNKFEQVRGGGGKDQGKDQGNGVMVGGCPQVNKYEQVQAVVTWIPLLPREQKDRQTDTTENITFPNYVTGGRYDRK